MQQKKLFCKILSKIAKKLVLSLATSLLVVKINIKDTLSLLDWISYIQYPIYFKKNEVWALLDLSSKINTMTLLFVSKLSFQI